jgi:hypothetical protein
METVNLKKLKGEGLKEIDLVAKVIGEKPPLSLEIQKIPEIVSEENQQRIMRRVTKPLEEPVNGLYEN